MSQQYPSMSPAPPPSPKKSIWEYIILIMTLIAMGMCFFAFFYGLGKLPWPRLLMSTLLPGILFLIAAILWMLGKFHFKKGLLVKNQTVPSKKATLFGRVVNVQLVWPIIKLGILISVIVVSFIGAKERIERMREQQRKADMQFTEIKEPKNGEEETADWQTYRNEEYGFEIKYPKDVFENILSTPKETSFKVSIENSTSLSVNNNSAISIQIGKNEEELPIEEWLENSSDDVAWIARKYAITKELYLLGDKRCIKITTSSMFQGLSIDQWTHILIPFGMKVVMISKVGSHKNYDLDKIFNQMLSTFSFTELTEVIRYIPKEAPDELCEGSCWINALSTIRRDAWRCKVGNYIKDPCFVFETNKSLVCEPYPPTGDKGILLKLTEPLPEPNISKDKFGEGWAWLIELEDGTLCRFVTGATGVLNGKRMNYSCDKEDMWVLGDLHVGTLWKAETAVVESVEEKLQAKSIELVPTKRVWQ